MVGQLSVQSVPTYRIKLQGKEYGEGFYSPGDVTDYNARISECGMWIERCKVTIKKNKN